MRRWWWRRRPPLVLGGQEARERAERDLERTRRETPYYERMHHEASVLMAENNIAAKVAAAINSGRTA